MNMYDKDNNSIGGLAMKFSSLIKYWLRHCTNGYIDLPVQPPVEVDKIWTFTKTHTALIITCNGVEVVNYLFADSSSDNCVAKLGGDVEQILFDSDYDEASDFYRAGKGLELIHTTWV